MRELPSRGRCHATFLLAHSACLKRVASLEEWVAVASDRSTFMAGACDIVGTAEILLNARLVTMEDALVVGRPLAALSSQADRTTFVGIAALLLKRFPPSWIISAVVDGEVIRELIPSLDLERLDWLGADLEPLILEVHRTLTHTVYDNDRKMLGDAGELAIMSALTRDGCTPVHVALVSDAYGYDIENPRMQKIERWEVKASVQSTRNRIFVSRNEFDKAMAFRGSWRLVQIVFSSSVMLNRQAAKSDVILIRELSGDALHSLAPLPLTTFRWTESAEFHPGNDIWTNSLLRVDDDFHVRFERLSLSRQSHGTG